MKRICYKESLPHCNQATDNHHQIDESLQVGIADEAKEPVAHPGTNDATEETKSPEGEGGGGKEAHLEAEQSVEEVENDREGLKRGHVFAFVIYSADTVEHHRGTGHGKHATHNATDGSDAGLG